MNLKHLQFDLYSPFTPKITQQDLQSLLFLQACSRSAAQTEGFTRELLEIPQNAQHELVKTSASY